MPCGQLEIRSVFAVPTVHGAMDCGQENFKLVWPCHQLLFGLLAEDHLPRVSRQSRLSANDRVIMRFPCIYFRVEENLR